MAKSIEQKAVDSLAAALSDVRFRNYEFCRIMSEEFPAVHKKYFELMVSYMNYLAVFEKHGWYPNNVDKEAYISAKVVDDLNRLLFP